LYPHNTLAGRRILKIQGNLSFLSVRNSRQIKEKFMTFKGTRVSGLSVIFRSSWFAWGLIFLPVLLAFIIDIFLLLDCRVSVEKLVYRAVSLDLALSDVTYNADRLNKAICKLIISGSFPVMSPILFSVYFVVTVSILVVSAIYYLFNKKLSTFRLAGIFALATLCLFFSRSFLFFVFGL